MKAIDTVDAREITSRSPQHLAWNGKKIPLDAAEPSRLDHDHDRSRIEAELGELSALGVEVTAVALPERGGAPRFAFKFPAGELHYRSRLALERAGFDVGQQLVDGRLSFYLSRRAQPSDGWSV